MFDVRAVADLDEYERALESISQYFGNERDREGLERFVRILPLERMLAAREDGSIVGGAGGFPFELSVPGGARVRCQGTTVVGVWPTHRRRGVLNAMMRAHLDQAHELGEPLAALWASEDRIYGRYGYGMASYAGPLTVSRDHTAFAVPLERRGTIRIVDSDEARRVAPPVWDALAATRPGVFSRSDDWWDARVFRDPPERRGGSGPKRWAVLELDGEVAGYAAYRHKMDWAEGVSVGKVTVVEALATSRQATAELWRYLLDIDWVATIETNLAPPDHPLLFLLAEPRRTRYRLFDGIWVRLVDVGAALSGRAYASDEEIVFGVRDAFCPWNEGRWRLAGGSAERSDADAEVALDVRDLGAAYLGGMSFSALAQNGRIEELRAGALARADRIFRWGLAPWCPEIF